MTPPKPANVTQPQFHLNIPALGAEGEAAPQTTPEVRGPSGISIGLEIPFDSGKVFLLLGPRKISLDKLRESLASESHLSQTQESALLQGLKNFLGEVVTELSGMLLGMAQQKILKQQLRPDGTFLPTPPPKPQPQPNPPPAPSPAPAPKASNGQ